MLVWYLVDGVNPVVNSFLYCVFVFVFEVLSVVVWYLVDGVNLVVNSDRRARDTLLLLSGCDEILLLLRHHAKNFELLRQKGSLSTPSLSSRKEVRSRWQNMASKIKSSEGGGLDWAW